MTALGKVTGFRLQVTVITLLLPIVVSLLTSTVLASHPVGRTGQYCDGDTIYIDNFDGTHTGGIDCSSSGQKCEEYDKDDEYLARCVAPATQTTPSPSPSPAGNQTCKDPNGCKVDSDSFRAPENTDYFITNIEDTLMKQAVGCSSISGDGGLANVVTEDRKSTDLKIVRCGSGGAAGALTNVMVALYHPPTSSIQYLADLGQNLGLVKPAYAQVGGSGADIISPILDLWRAVRNIAYVAFIAVFVVVGLLIMFRARINPQTVVSAQQALPGLVIGLILVTFSYFLAALLIDTAFISIQVVGQIFDKIGHNVFDSPAGYAQDSNVFKLFTGAIRLPENIGDFTGGIYATLNSAGGIGAIAGIPAVIGLIIGTIINPGLGSAIGLGVGALAGPAVIGLVVPLILILALLIQFFRLLWQLISSYISLLVATVTGPLIIMFASIPGRGGVMGLWWKSLLGNALVFPAVFAAFMFAGVILGTETGSFNAAPPLFGGLSTQLLRLIIAYGIILGTPAIPGMVRKAIGVPELGPITQTATQGALLGGQLGVAGARLGYGELWRGGAQRGARATGPLSEGYDLLRKNRFFRWLPRPEVPVPPNKE